MTIQSILFVLPLLTFLLEQSSRGVAISGCIANERNALLNFKKSLIDKNSRLASWNGNNCCKWKGVSCNNLTAHVIRLDLRNPHPFTEFDDVLYNEWSLGGQLNPSLIGLKQLNYLDLSMNHFDGFIPKFLGSLRNLRYLNLSLSGFQGLIPHHLGNLSRLEYLDLNFGRSGDSSEVIIDDSYWISHLASLKHLTMKNAIFTSLHKSIEALNILPNIVELCLSSCNISDFPSSLPYVNFTNLSYLDLSSNFIDQKNFPLWLFDIKSLTHIDLRHNHFRSIPDALGNLTSLQYMDISENDFSGALPKALKKLCNLRTMSVTSNSFTDMHEFKEIFFGCLKDSIEHLDLSSNNLNGCLPNSFGEMHKLKTLDLSFNLLFGSISESFGEMHKLETLDLSYNLLSGSIPESLGHLEALEELLLSKNKLNGTVPRSIGQLSNLVLLHLDENYLEGVISEVHFTRLFKLKELTLQSNNLIMNVSHDWIPPFKLKVIGMGSCKMGPYFPQWLKTQVNLFSLNLSSSDIADYLPDWFWSVFVTHDVITLDLSNNGIKGSLPPLLELSFNHFDLNSNFFEGPLPPSLNITYLFDVSNNSFSGSIQPILGNITLEYIFLSRNNFSGEIPLSICSTESWWIDLSRNLLTGELPNCWNHFVSADFPNLHLDFSRNNLYGNIPHSLGALTGLTSLHLSYNQLSGSLPINLRNCVSLITLDLGMNHLAGIIPTWIGDELIILKALILRSNNFMGNVPSNLSKLKELRILDLANNKLTGRVPLSFGNFRVMMDMHPTMEDDFLRYADGEIPNLMEYVQLTIKKQDWNYDKLLTQITIIDLSFNNLSEHIPKELGNLHLLFSLNLSGNHLMGPIPDAIGLMNSLESLDLSRNELSGNIPSTMSNMTTLNSLNLSYNNLFGKIPSGNQLQTFSNESYIGNPKLCGFPLSQPCSRKTPNVQVSVDEVIKSDYWYVSIALGFVFGSWIFLGTFLVKKRWQDAFFQFVDYVYDAIFHVTTVSIKRFKRKMGNENALD